MSTTGFFRTMLLLSVAAASMNCAPAEDEDFEDLGDVADGKSDAPSIMDRAVTLPAATATKPGRVRRRVKSTVDFRVSLVTDGTAAARIFVYPAGVSATQVTSLVTDDPTLTVKASGAAFYDIYLENLAKQTVKAKLSALAATGDLTALKAAALENLRRVSKEIDVAQLHTYGLTGTNEDQFMTALETEYASEPAMYETRLKSLASMVFFSLPDVPPAPEGKITPFHGLDDTGFQGVMSMEDAVFNDLAAQNGSVRGVRPFSVCETTFIIDKFVKAGRSYAGFAPYKAEYTTYAASCPQKDKDEWYNFRGLGGLRPSWLESNIQDRFLRRMAKQCQAPTAEFKAACDKWNTDRFAYRQDGNRQLASRFMFYDPSQEAYLADAGNTLLLLEDRNGDGVGEMLRPGAVTLTSGEQGTLAITSSGTFSGVLKYTGPDGAQRSITAEEIVAEDKVDPGFKAAYKSLPDFGLTKLFSDPTGCTGEEPSDSECPLLKRFYVTIDRHENFYQTYTAMTPHSSGLGAQPSPLVACSITLAASHQWDTAGTPNGGTAGFIFLMRVPFKQIFAGVKKSVSTLSPGPEITAIQDVYDGSATLDLSKLWLDIATLSHNQYQSEHEISKFGAVPAEQIEGILVVRKPAAVP